VIDIALDGVDAGLRADGVLDNALRCVNMQHQALKLREKHPLMLTNALEHYPQLIDQLPALDREVRFNIAALLSFFRQQEGVSLYPDPGTVCHSIQYYRIKIK
jgi:hypothetical protein